jgi:hypothetical protein
VKIVLSHGKAPLAECQVVEFRESRRRRQAAPFTSQSLSGALLQVLDRVRAGVDQLAVPTLEGEEAHLVVVGIALGQAQHLHTRDAADEVVAEVAEQNRLRRRRRNRHVLVDDIGIAVDRVRLLDGEPGHPQRTPDAVLELLDHLQRRIRHHEPRVLAVGRIDRVLELDQIVIGDRGRLARGGRVAGRIAERRAGHDAAGLARARRRS